jgi:hypothetical protein
MPNQSGSVYGLTILSPILNDPNVHTSHDCAIRNYLAALPRDHHSPFAKISSTHLSRLVVMDDVIFVGVPAHEEHLQSKYLVFESNLDGDLEPYLTMMATKTPEFVDAVWSHCVGYPGVRDVSAWIAYMKKCQIDTTFYFADVNTETVQFIAEHQGMPAAELQAAFQAFYARIKHMPDEEPGRHAAPGGHQVIPLNKSMAAHHG